MLTCQIHSENPQKWNLLALPLDQQWQEKSQISYGRLTSHKTLIVRYIRQQVAKNLLKAFINDNYNGDMFEVQKKRSPFNEIGIKTALLQRDSKSPVNKLQFDKETNTMKPFTMEFYISSFLQAV